MIFDILNVVTVLKGQLSKYLIKQLHLSKV